MTVHIDEDTLSEQPALALLKQLGYAYVHGDDLAPGCPDRATARNVVLAQRLRAAIKKLNPWINDGNLASVVHRLSEVQATDLMEANQQVHSDLTKHLSREQEVKGKAGFQTVRVIDWEEPENNDFVVVNQLRIKGDDDRRPDAIVYVNGLPLAVIECKAPSRPYPKDEGVKQLRVYQGSIPRLFWPNQFVVVTAGSAGAWYGSIGAPGEFFFDWRDPWPTSREEVETLVGRAPTPQDLLLANLFEKARFLDHVRNFVVFEREGNKTIKKLPRYQQFRAVNKAIERLRTKTDAAQRSGIVWHTQGSGKSLTMVWLALKLRRDPLNENPTIVIVTDRNDLDRQISSTFKNCGYTVHRAKGVKDLHARLKEPGGLTLTTTIQKFLPESRGKKADEDETGLDTGKEQGAPAIPLLTDAGNVFVLVDEAHRTQYRSLAANMRTALPNATFLGFTGTPIDKKDRQTHKTFGSYIDTYTIQQAVDDEATVPIFYEGRLPELRVEGASNVDELFDRFFAKRSDEERREIKKRYATLEAIACAPDRINKIALNVVDHFERFIAPGGFKAQVVAVSREAAVLYKERLDQLNGPQSAVVISASHKDEDPKIKAWHRTKEQQDEIIKRFKSPDDPLKMLIVCDMLLTGFDAPIEQVMYLDSGLKEHNLLQAIARVNRRCGPDKSYGLIVDYWGVSEFLEKALAVFTDTDIKGALTPRKDELPRFEALHARALGYFREVKHKNGVFANKTEANDIVERCVQVMEPDDVRAEFRGVFRALSQCYDRLMPDPKLNSYRESFKLLGLVVKGAQRFDRDKLNLDGCGEKVRQLIAESVRALDIEVLVDPIPILAPAFDQHVERLRSPEAKASEMEHAIRHEIRIKLEEDPVFYESLREKLEKIIADRRAERLSQKDLFDRLRGLIVDARGREQKAQSLDMSEHEFAVYGLLGGATEGEVAIRHRKAAKQIVELLSDRAVIDWEGKPSVVKEMRRELKRLLRVADLSESEAEIEAAATRIIDLAKTKLRTKS